MRRSGAEGLLDAVDGWGAILSLIGGHIAAFQKIEENLANCIAMLIDYDDFHVGAIVTSELSFRAKLGIFTSLVLYRLDANKLPQEFADFVRRAYAAEERRNLVVHSYWDPSSENPARAQRIKPSAKSKKGFIQAFEEVPPGTLARDIEEFDALSDLVMSMYEEWFGHIP